MASLGNLHLARPQNAWFSYSCGNFHLVSIWLNRSGSDSTGKKSCDAYLVLIAHVFTDMGELPVIRTKNYPQDLGQLLELAAAGDSEAFEHIYTQTSVHVYPLVKTILHDSTVTLEVVQDIYVQIWSRVPDYDPSQGTPSTWVMAVAHSLAVERLRNNRADAVMHYAEALGCLRDLESGRTTYPTILAASDLTSIQCAAIYLAYFQGLTGADIASALGLDQEFVNLSLNDGLHRVEAWLRWSSLAWY